jgi:hypothetical protein
MQPKFRAEDMVIYQGMGKKERVIPKMAGFLCHICNIGSVGLVTP